MTYPVDSYPVPSSDPTKDPYTVIIQADGTTTCNCAGYAFRQKCRHATKIEQEMAARYRAPAVARARRTLDELNDLLYG